VKRSILVVTILVAFALGVWHLLLAGQAILVFRNNEPLTSWGAILLGPTLTIVGAIIATVRPKWGGYCLLFGACASFLIFLVEEGIHGEHWVPFLVRITIPMALVGTALLLGGMSKPQPTP